MDNFDRNHEKLMLRETIVKDIVVAMLDNGFMDDYEADETVEAVCKACDAIRKHVRLD